MEPSLSFQLEVIDYYLTFQYLLQYRSSEYLDINPSHYTPNSTVYCPFHENRDTKAAKLYPKDSKSEKLYCFAENRLYFPHSLLSPPKRNVSSNLSSYFHSLVPYDPSWVFSAVWNHLSEQERKQWMNDNPDLSFKSSSPYNHLYKSYRNGELSLFSLLENIIDF